MGRGGKALNRDLAIADGGQDIASLRAGERVWACQSESVLATPGGAGQPLRRYREVPSSASIGLTMHAPTRSASARYGVSDRMNLEIPSAR